MDEIYSCLDQLQRTLESKIKIPLTDLIIIAQEDLMGMVEEIQESIPEELEQSIQIKKEADSIMEKARKEVEEINKKVQEIKIKKLKSSPEIQENTIEATQRLNKARKTEYTEIKETEEFAGTILNNIEEKVMEHLRNVKKAREILQEKKITPSSEEQN